MKNYTVHQAKSQLSKLIRRALQGEEIIITNRHHPVARLTAIHPPKKRLGFLGAGVWADPAFNAPLKDFKSYQ
jgi:prevent-host-death family protein